MDKIAFVILTWNSEKCIARCLRSVYGLDSSRLKGQIYIIDNNSTDNTVEVIEQVKAECEPVSGFECSLTLLGENEGTTRSRNIALRRILKERKYPYTCILDSDTQVNTSAILTLITALKSQPRCAVCGPRMHDENGIYQQSGRNIPTLTEKLLKVLPLRSLRLKGERMQSGIPPEGKGCISVGYLLSACWMLPTQIFESVGLLDERIFYAPEDVEFCIRCRRAGYEVMYCYDADILHQWQRLSRRKLFSRHNFEHIRGLIYMFIKHRFLFRVPQQWMERASDGGQ